MFFLLSANNQNNIPVSDLLSSPQLWAVGVLVLFVYFVFNVWKMLMDNHKEEKIQVADKIERGMDGLSSAVRDVSKTTNSLIEKQCEFMGKIVEKNNLERVRTQEQISRQAEAMLKMAQSVEDVTVSINKNCQDSEFFKKMVLDYIRRRENKV